ncbi:MAG TPA: putative baseplate assembly protein [Bryobacteraceae bacterium]|nr:putative baseplate assembly protein [Bryobacteraceae bacterium]
MATQFTCKNLLRRGLVLEKGTLNGIDYLEVLDEEAPPGSPRQQTLVVHFLQANPPLTVSNFRIDGGVRITPVNCVWAFPAPTVPVPPANLKEQAYFAGLPAADHIMVIRTNVAGDFSTYTLRIIQSADDLTPPTGFDPRLSSVDFGFKVECPSDFDCASSTVCPPDNLPAPLIDYLAKDYASFRRLMLDRMAVTMPAWTERHPADLAIALVEVLAYGADHVSYYQDAVATEAYLGTARKRVSVRRHAVLLDYAMHDGSNARAWVYFQVDKSVTGQLLPGPTADEPGTALLTRTNLPPGAITAAQEAVALGQGALVFETLHDVVLRVAHNEIRFYTWSDDQCCLPQGATEATLRHDNSDIELAVGDALLIEEKLSPVTGAAADADPSHRCVVRLTSVIPGTDPLDSTPILEVEWADADALPFPLCLSTTIIQASGPTPIEDVSVARGNIVLADHGMTVASPEALSPSIVPENVPYRPRLQRTGITFHVPYDDAAARQQPASTVATQDPRAALPAITLTDGVNTWLPERDLLESDRFAREFVVETEDDGTDTLRFGDGELGAPPVSGLTATYRVGNGSAGNVGAGAVVNAVTSLGGIVALRNPLPAAGGIDPETLDQVRQYAPQAFRTQERAVTEADYAVVAAQYPQVQKAQATLRWTGSWYTMFVTVDRAGGQPVDAAFSEGLRAFLESFRLAGYDLEIEPPVFVSLDIAFTVCVSPGYFRSNVEKALYDTFSNRVLPDGTLGFFHPDNFTFGQPVYLSRIVAAAMAVAGVHWVDTDDTPPKPNHFQRWGQLPNGETAAGEIDFARLEIARLDNDPNQPENGKIEFFLEGGL